MKIINPICKLVAFILTTMVFGCSSDSDHDEDQTFDLSGTWHLTNNEVEYGKFVIRDYGSEIEILGNMGRVKLRESGTQLIDEDGNPYYLTIVSDNELTVDSPFPEEQGNTKYLKLNSTTSFSSGFIEFQSDSLVNLNQDFDIYAQSDEIEYHDVDGSVYYPKTLSIIAFTENDYFEIRIDVGDIAVGQYSVGNISPPLFLGASIGIYSPGFPYQFNSVSATDGYMNINHHVGNDVEGSGTIIVRDSSAFAEQPEYEEVYFNFSVEAPNWPLPLN